jgi:hypothetical protein
VGQRGINFVVFFIIAYVIYGNQPKVGASADTHVSFYDGDRTRILIATVIFGLAGWASDGFWAPDGAYSRFISQIIGLAWVTGRQRAPRHTSPLGARA